MLKEKKINYLGKEPPPVAKYAQTFTLDDLSAVIQWLEIYAWDQKVETELKELVREATTTPDSDLEYIPSQEGCREKIETLKKLRKKPRRNRGVGKRVPTRLLKKMRAEKVMDQPEIKTVVGLCPHCNGKVVGEPVPQCESKVTGRLFYKECSECTYYAEVVSLNNETFEREGGIDYGS